MKSRFDKYCFVDGKMPGDLLRGIGNTRDHWIAQVLQVKKTRERIIRQFMTVQNCDVIFINVETGESRIGNLPQRSWPYWELILKGYS